MLAAVESRDVDRLVVCFTEEASWQNVPHPPAHGLIEIRQLFDPIVTLSDRIHWEVGTEIYEDGRGWLERIDHFWIDGDRHSVSCNGVFDVDVERGLVRSVRDYVDLGEWRSRIGPVYKKAAARTGLEVVTRHLDGVRTGDPIEMARDYAIDAVLERAAETHRGRSTITGYFRTVPARLGSATLSLGEPEGPAGDGSIAVRWQIHGDTQLLASGTDIYRVTTGRITYQRVLLDGSDF